MVQQVVELALAGGAAQVAAWRDLDGHRCATVECCFQLRHAARKRQRITGMTRNEAQQPRMAQYAAPILPVGLQCGLGHGQAGLAHALISSISSRVRHSPVTRGLHSVGQHRLSRGSTDIR
jgi:hypothetical protein